MMRGKPLLLLECLAVAVKWVLDVLLFRPLIPRLYHHRQQRQKVVTIGYNSPFPSDCW